MRVSFRHARPPPKDTPGSGKSEGYTKKLLVLAYFVKVLTLLSNLTLAQWLRNADNSSINLFNIISYGENYQKTSIPETIFYAAIITSIIETLGILFIFRVSTIGKKSKTGMLLYVYLCCISILLIFFLVTDVIVIYKAAYFKAKLARGMKASMHDYMKNIVAKKNIDQLQLKLKCCGFHLYDEWFHIQWIPPEIYGSEEKCDKKCIASDVPFSCCTLDTSLPCVHHNILQRHGVYNYLPQKDLNIWLDGCEQKMYFEMNNISYMLAIFLMAITGLLILDVINCALIQLALPLGKNSDFCPCFGTNTQSYSPLSSEDHTGPMIRPDKDSKQSPQPMEEIKMTRVILDCAKCGSHARGSIHFKTNQRKVAASLEAADCAGQRKTKNNIDHIRQ